MDRHKNAPLTSRGREMMVRAVVDCGLSKAAAARQFNTTPRRLPPGQTEARLHHRQFSQERIVETWGSGGLTPIAARGRMVFDAGGGRPGRLRRVTS